MGRVPITIMGFRCECCTYEWIPKDFQEPEACPKCNSDVWNVPLKNTLITYEEFRDRVKQILLKSRSRMTWTEIRTGAQLPQKFPNNQWVHKMENDIGLSRQKDAHGIIQWEIKV
ncbi:hypothetical protein JP09_004625 [Dehalogenimonas etheniformans]|uniref:Rubredoxin-like domain-containing protein n=1 Tax=Dehalogenimonas etheniformans TaxID=1536648 RepID=A0A2P5P7Y1_9CHLR|nr:hypothetical protein JP09_004625 [Dehalogenimonas etheniformans]